NSGADQRSTHRGRFVDRFHEHEASPNVSEQLTIDPSTAIADVICLWEIMGGSRDGKVKSEYEFLPQAIGAVSSLSEDATSGQRFLHEVAAVSSNKPVCSRISPCSVDESLDGKILRSRRPDSKDLTVERSLWVFSPIKLDLGGHAGDDSKIVN